MELEKYIQNNIEAFNEEEPPRGHEQRFLKKLQKREKRDLPHHGTLRFLKIAAVFIIVLLAGNLGRLFFMSDVSRENHLAVKSKELREVEQFYNVSITSGMRELDRIMDESNHSEEEREMIQREMEELDSLFHNLQADYKANPRDPRVNAALIDYYQTKMDLIQLIISRLRQAEDVSVERQSGVEL